MESLLIPAAEAPDEAPRLYARFSRRFRAIVVDSIVYALALVLLIVLLELAGGDRTNGRAMIFAWLGFVMLYEPILVWRRGATLGHAYANIRVVSLASGGNPGFLRAFGRFWLKGILGLLAFVFMGTTRRHQALHDLVFGTTVEVRDPSRATAYDYVTERSADQLGLGVPAWRRTLLILVYSFVAFLLFGVSLVAVESTECLNARVCSPTEKLWEGGLGVLWLGAEALVIILGWRGQLPGARGQRQPDQTPHAARSWPLFLVAACSFIPVLGFVFASIGLTWGLLSDRPRAMRAAVLAGVGGMLNLFGGLVLFWQLQDDPTSMARRASSARRDLARVVDALENYREAHGQYPQSLVVFTQLPLSLKLVNVSDISTTRGFPMPRLYSYRRSEDGRWYDVYGVGQDGQPGTADDVRPELPDSVARRSGYRPSR